MNSSSYSHVGETHRSASLTPDQQGLWFECRTSNEANASYNLSMGLTLTGRVDLSALKLAFQHLALNNESFRCSFPEINGEAACRIASPESFTLPILELDLPDNASSESYVERVAAQELSTPFNVSEGPLARVTLLKERACRVTFLITLHHLISDGRSMALIGNELASLYTSIVQGEEVPRPKPSQLDSTTSLQQAPEAQAKRTTDAEYWQEELQDAPSVTELPWDHASPVTSKHLGDQVGFHFEEAETSALRSLAKDHGVSTFTALYASWALLISKLTGQSEVVIGVAVSKSGSQFDSDFIGFQVGMLPIRIALNEGSFSALLAQVKRKVLLAREHGSLALSELVRMIRGSRDPSIHPLFQTSFTWPHLPESAPQFEGLSVEILACSSNKFGLGVFGPIGKHDVGAYSLTAFGGTSTSVYAKHSLAVSAWKVDGQIACGIEFSIGLLERSTVLRWIGHWKNLLRSIASDPGAALASHGLMSVEEQAAHVLSTNILNEGFLGEGKPLFRLVQEYASLAPNRLAIDGTDGSVSFSELEQRANRTASRLYAAGIRPRHRVAVCLRRGAGMIVSILALQKLNATFIPIDPDHPISRLRAILDDCSPAAIIGDDSTIPAIKPLSFNALMDLAHLKSETTGEEICYPEPSRDPSDISYIIYTSGTTGEPKGVCTTNAAYEAFLAIASEFCKPDLGGRVLQFSAFTFDAFVMELAMSLARGATLCIPDPGITLAGDDLADQVDQLLPSHAFLPPSVLATLDPSTDLGSVVCLLSGAEPVSRELVNKWSVNRAFANVYGPTETTVICTAHFVTDSSEDQPPIGRPFSNSRVYVLDSAGNLQPAGVRGELFVGGRSVASHYLNRPQLTEEKFLPDPFSRSPGARMYRTGDFGCWRSDGLLQFLGRSDSQIKIRGFRVEIGEVEHHLRAVQGVIAAAVTVHSAPNYKDKLVAYFEASTALTSKYLRDKLRARIPTHMIPAVFVRVDSLPLNRNGKVDRRALQSVAAPLTSDSAYSAPVGERERLISALWSQLLGIPRIGRDDHFFDLGGHSLLAVQVISRVRQNLGVDVALADLFAHPVLADFAACIDSKGQDRLPPIEPVDRQAPLPLSFAQQRLWFLAQLGEHASRAYHMPLGLALHGPLDRPALQRALDRLVERHEALRTHFALQDGMPVQVIEPPAPFVLHEHDLRAEPDPDQAAGALAAQEADQPFDLERGPLIRGRLLCLADEHHHLLLTQHHILSDGWSLGVLTRELGALYDAFAQGRPDPLPPLPIQYADYAVWQRQHVSGERLQAQADYWRRQLADAPARLDLPTDRPRPAEQDFAGGMVAFEIDAGLTAALRRLGQRHGTTLYQTLLASWALLLSRLSGQEDLMIGTPTANRDHGQTQDLIGFFVNALPLRIDLSGNPTVAELLARTRATALDALAHHDIPFEQVVDLVGTERNLAHNPVFQVAFAWMEDPVGDAGFGQASATLLVPASPARSPFDLALSISPKNDRLFCDLSFARALFESTSAERFAALWQNLLSNMISRSGSRMSHIPIMGEAMLDEVKHFAKGPKKERADKRQLIHERAALHAHTQPAALAAVQGAHSLSYEDLLDLASRFAKSLVGLGIKPGQIVGIQMSSRMEQPVAFLGCLMAGGVYFPIDRELPEDRISFMIADAKPALVVVAAGEFASPGCTSIPQVTLDLDELRRSTESGVSIPDLNDDADGYLIYTSGSTGTPKGVAIRHKAVLATVADNADLFNVHPGSRILQVAPIGFDMSVFDLVLSLCCGGTLCLPSGGQKLIGDQLAKEIHGSRASHICMTPSVLSTLADTDQLASLTTITLAGEPLPGPLSRYWARHRRVLNAYGPTEAAIASTCYLCPANEMEDPPIGRPLANVNCHVLDGHGAPVPIGVAGELHIGGAGVAQGYRDRPGLTAERFIPDPWSTQPGALLFKSGDIVKWRADGNLCFVGRNDGQVKLRGFRIELGEVESRLATHPLVTEAVVVLREDAAREKQIVAYLVAAPGHEQEQDVPKKLRSYLADFLPEYMIPGAFVVLQQMPLTANGKLAHDRLPEPDSTAFALAGFEAPEGELENLIADSWMDVLGRRGVGRHDNFFHLGGHSLLLFRVSARLSSAGVTVPLPDMFRYPTISGLAAHITGGLLGKGQTAAERLTEGLGGPVFAFHDGSGMLAYARQLAEAFGQGAPAFYGLPSCPVGEIQPDTMAAMAERMLGLILDLQPRGPYRLVGWSFGGLLAYETAIQLKRRGHRIEFLGMLDSHLLANLMPPELISEEKAHLLTQMQTEAFGNPRLQARLEDLRKGVDDMSLQELVEAARAAIRDPLIFPWLRGMPESEAAAYLRRQQALHHAAMSWLPTEAIEAVLFTATGSARRADKSWKDSLAANALVVAEVAGDHHSMLQPPFLEGLALKIESWLSRSEAPR